MLLIYTCSLPGGSVFLLAFHKQNKMHKKAIRTNLNLYPKFFIYSMFLKSFLHSSIPEYWSEVLAFQLYQNKLKKKNNESARCFSFSLILHMLFASACRKICHYSVFLNVFSANFTLSVNSRFNSDQSLVNTFKSLLKLF